MWWRSHLSLGPGLITSSDKWISDLESRALEESSWEERWEEEG
jgi:hypothetical protein